MCGNNEIISYLPANKILALKPDYALTGVGKVVYVRFTTVAPNLAAGGINSTQHEPLQLGYAAITWKQTEGNIVYRNS